MNRVAFSSITDHWETPVELYRSLNKEFHFNYDPCPRHPDCDGLNTKWGSRTFCNPPYSGIKAWAAKAHEEAQSGKTVVLLIPSRTDTRWWHAHVMTANEIRFCRGRLKFGGAKNSAPFPSCIAIWNPIKESPDARP